MYKKITSDTIHELQPIASVVDFPLEGEPQNTLDLSDYKNVYFYINLTEAGASYLFLQPDFLGDIDRGHKIHQTRILKKSVEEIILESTWWFENSQ